MWSLILMVAPYILKAVIWKVDARQKAEKSFRDWVAKQRQNSLIYVEEKQSYDAQVAELTKKEGEDESHTPKSN